MTQPSPAVPASRNRFPAAMRAAPGFPGMLPARTGTAQSLGLLLARAAGTLNFDRTATRSTLSQALALLDADGGREAAPPATGGLAPWQARKAAACIEAHLEPGVRVTELAAMTRLSRSYFSRAFKVTFGRSPMQYLIDRRVARAQAIMLSTDKALSEVALDCGFADQAHLSRLFHRCVGEAPGAWRRARRQDAGAGLPTLQ